jgi:hypothetical protein
VSAANPLDIEPPVHVDGDVLRARDLPSAALHDLLAKYGLRGCSQPLGEPIVGSCWGDCEAGLVRDCVYWRADTPIHSILHETAHVVCMDAERRRTLERDAGGDFAEEDAVCYLQILLADELEGVGRARMWRDMDAWGYTFRLGSAHAWFEHDAADARAWLIAHGLIDAQEAVTWRLRT